MMKATDEIGAEPQKQSYSTEQQSSATVSDHEKCPSLPADKETTKTDLNLGSPNPGLQQQEESASSAGVDSVTLEFQFPKLDENSNNEDSTRTTEIESDIDVVGGLEDDDNDNPIAIGRIYPKHTTFSSDIVNLADDLDVSSDEEDNSSSDGGDNNQHQAVVDQSIATKDNKMNLLVETLSTMNDIFTAELAEASATAISTDKHDLADETASATGIATDKQNLPEGTTTSTLGLGSTTTMEVANVVATITTAVADLDNNGQIGTKKTIIANHTENKVSIAKDDELDQTNTSLDVHLSGSIVDQSQATIGNFTSFDDTSFNVTLSESAMEFEQSSMNNNMNDSGAGTNETEGGCCSTDDDADAEDDCPPAKMRRFEFDRDLIPDRISGFDRSHEARGLVMFCVKFANSDKQAWIGTQEAHRDYPDLVHKFYQNLATKRMPF